MVGDPVGFREGERGGRVGSGLGAVPRQREREGPPTEREDPPEPVLASRKVERGFERSGAFRELAVVEPRQRLHGGREERDGVASADAEEVGDHVGGPEQFDRLVGRPVNLAGREVVQTEACVQRGRRRGLSDLEVAATSQAPVGLHGGRRVMPGELRGQQVDVQRHRHVGELGPGRGQPTDERQGFLAFEEALAPLDDHPHHLSSVAGGEQLLDSVGQLALTEQEAGGPPAQARLLGRFGRPQPVAQQISEEVVVAKPSAAAVSSAPGTANVGRAGRASLRRRCLR